jgi:TolB-like protein
MSGDPEQEFVSDGIAEDVISALALSLAVRHRPELHLYYKAARSM